MTKAIVSIPDGIARDLMESTGMQSAAKVVTEALGLYQWAVEQKKLGRKIMSVNEDGTDLVNINMVGLETARIKAEIKYKGQL